MTSLDWMPQIETLSKDYRTYALDQIYDVGRSIYTRPVEKPEDFVQWLEELFTELELDNISYKKINKVAIACFIVTRMFFALKLRKEATSVYKEKGK